MKIHYSEKPRQLRSPPLPPRDSFIFHQDIVTGIIFVVMGSWFYQICLFVKKDCLKNWNLKSRSLYQIARQFFKIKCFYGAFLLYFIVFFMILYVYLNNIKDTNFQRRNIKGDSKNSTFNCQKTNHAILMLRDTGFNIRDC